MAPIKKNRASAWLNLMRHGLLVVTAFTGLFVTISNVSLDKLFGDIGSKNYITITILFTVVITFFISVGFTNFKSVYKYINTEKRFFHLACGVAAGLVIYYWLGETDRLDKDNISHISIRRLLFEAVFIGLAVSVGFFSLRKLFSKIGDRLIKHDFLKDSDFVIFIGIFIALIIFGISLFLIESPGPLNSSFKPLEKFMGQGFAYPIILLVVVIAMALLLFGITAIFLDRGTSTNKLWHYVRSRIKKGKEEKSTKKVRSKPKKKIK